jgi:hypothetical protein
VHRTSVLPQETPVFEFRQTVRRLSRSSGFTLTVILTPALGIGGTAAIFALAC